MGGGRSPSFSLTVSVIVFCMRFALSATTTWFSVLLASTTFTSNLCRVGESTPVTARAGSAGSSLGLGDI